MLLIPTIQLIHTEPVKCNSFICFISQDYEHIGRGFCETLLDYSDENPNKVTKRNKLQKKIKKLRKAERSQKRLSKLIASDSP